MILSIGPWHTRDIPRRAPLFIMPQRYAPSGCLWR